MLYSTCARALLVASGLLMCVGKAPLGEDHRSCKTNSCNVRAAETSLLQRKQSLEKLVVEDDIESNSEMHQEHSSMMRDDDVQLDANAGAPWPLMKADASCGQTVIKEFNRQSFEKCQENAVKWGASFFEHKSSAAVCRLFAQCYQTSVHKGASVYENPENWHLDALGQSCPTPPFDARKRIYPLYAEKEVKDSSDCRALALRKMHNYYSVTQFVNYRCRLYSSCKTPVWKTGFELFAKSGESLGKNKWCPSKTKDITVKDPADCQRRASSGGFYALFARDMLLCRTFETCSPASRAPDEATSIYMRPPLRWRISEACSALGDAEPASVSHFQPMDSCQTTAMEREHRYFSFKDGACATAKACGAAGSGATEQIRSEPAAAGPRPRLTCKGEAKIREIVKDIIDQTMPKATGDNGLSRGTVHKGQANVLRAMWHDGQDHNRLMLRKKDTDTWERLDRSDIGDYGGLDGCLYEPLDSKNLHAFTKTPATFKGSDNTSPKWTNGNLAKKSVNQDALRVDKLSYNFAVSACKKLCCSPDHLSEADRRSLCGAVECDKAGMHYMDKCRVDVTALGALVVIENADGPRIGMTWGRRQGDCRRPFKKTAAPLAFDTSRVALNQVPLGIFDNTSVIFNDFAHAGFSVKEAVALMGAHSIGKIHKYAGGFSVRNRGGGFCDDPEKLKPPLTRNLFDNMSTGEWHGNCEVPPGKNKCWEKTEGEDKVNKLQPTRYGSEQNMRNSAMTFGTGGFWDRTPDKLDNDYYGILGEQRDANKKVCCGPMTEFGCATEFGKSPDDKRVRIYEMQRWDGTKVEGAGCSVDYCMRSQSGDMLNRAPPREKKDGNHALLSTKMHVASKNSIHRLYLLGADWSLIGHPDAIAETRRFARNETAFFDAFGKVMQKLLNLGYADGELRSCEG